MTNRKTTYVTADGKYQMIYTPQRQYGNTTHLASFNLPKWCATRGDLVSYDAGTGKYKLNSGGWNSMTTAKRMTEYLPGGYYVARRNWVLTLFGPDLDPAGVPVVDGMEV